MFKITIWFYGFVVLSLIACLAIGGENNDNLCQDKDLYNMLKNSFAEGEEVDMQKLIVSIRNIQNNNIAVDQQKKLIELLGEILSNVENIKFSNMPLTGRNPRSIVRDSITEVFLKLKNKEALQYLIEFYIKNKGGDKCYDIKEAIEKLGGKIPEIPPTPSPIPDVSKDEMRPLSEKEKGQIEDARKIINSNKVFEKLVLREAMEVLSKHKIRSANKRIIEVLETGKIGEVDTEFCWQYMRDIGGDELVEYAKTTLLKPVPQGADLESFEEHEAIVRTSAMGILSKYSSKTEKDLEFFEQLLNQKDYRCIHDSCQMEINALKNKLRKTKE